jgi:hypothetical protein
MAAIIFGGAIAATAAPAEARDRDGYYGYGGYDGYSRHHHGNSTGTAIAAGVVGLALGAALASSSNHRGGYYGNSYYDNSYAYDRGYYSDRYYGDRYYRGGYYAPRAYYDRGYEVCETSRWVYDPYIDRRVRVRSTYAC